MSDEELATYGLFVEKETRQPTLRPEAVCEVKQRLARYREMKDELEEAGRREEALAVRKRLEDLDSALGQSLGLGGKARDLGHRRERPRTAVKNAIKRAIRKFEKACPELYSHLYNQIQTGNTCRYTPDRDISWKTDKTS
jgi:hypothetical protein